MNEHPTRSTAFDPTLATSAMLEAPSSEPSTLFLEREAALQRFRRALLEFGDRIDVLGAHVCGCGSAECMRRDPDVFPVERLMAYIVADWDPATHPAQETADPAGTHAAELRQETLDFAGTFDVICNCNDPGCGRRERAAELPMRDLLDLIWDLWAQRSGNFGLLPTDEEIERVLDHRARNLRLLGLFVDRAAVWIPMDRWLEATARHRRVRASAWYAEARWLVEHGRDYCLPGIRSEQAALSAIDMSIRIPDLAGFASAERRDLVLVFADVIDAIAMLGIVHESVHEALYEAVAPMVPVADLRVRLARQG